MALKTVVKVSGITNLSDARYCAGMGVEFLGFSPEPNTPHFTELSKYKEIIGWVSGIKFVGELTKFPPSNLSEYNFDALQINNITLLPVLKKFEKPIFLEVNLIQKTDIPTFEKTAQKYKNDVTYFLLKSTELPIDEVTETLKKLCAEFPIILDFEGITPENTSEILSKIQPKGVGLQGGEEVSPGLRDFEGLADMLEALEEEEVW